jgi:dihydrofolate reductase
MRRRIEGYAIISTDGMIADANGDQPPELHVEADQRFFHEALDRADAVVHGRHSYEGKRMPARRRILLTRQIAALEPHPTNARVIRWNPAGASFDAAVEALGVDGLFAIIGGTDVFGLFLTIGYDLFHLTRAPRARLPGGRPVFPQVPHQTPEALLEAHGLVPGPQQMLDETANATMVTWKAPAAA